MGTLWQDVRYGLRVMAKTPAVMLAVVLTLALGIGANAAVFSFINSLLLRPLPVTDADKVVRLSATGADGRRFDTFSYADFQDLQQNLDVFTELAAHQYTSIELGTGVGGSDPVAGEVVTGNYFRLFGLQAHLGRLLTPEDDVDLGAHPVAVISYPLWQRRFGARPDIQGQKIYLGGYPFTVIGVAQQGYRGSYDAFAADVWVPMMMHEQARPRGVPLDRRGWGWLRGTGRLRPGVTRSQAQLQIDRVVGQLQNEQVISTGIGFEIVPATPLPDDLREPFSRILLFIISVISLVLLVGCSNVASLLLARVRTRQREIAIRQSQGASGFRLLRQWLTESTMLALLGGTVGTVFALWFQDAMRTLIPPSMAMLSPELPLDGAVLGYTLMVTLLTGLVFGSIPALRARRLDVVSGLKMNGTAVTETGGRSRFFGTLVVFQVTVSVVLLIGAGLLLGSLRNAKILDTGFNATDVLLTSVDLGREGDSEVKARGFYDDLLDRLEHLPGVRAVTYARVVPLGGDRERLGFTIPGHQPPEGSDSIPIAYNVVGPDYFGVMSIPLLEGRGFDSGDGGPNAAPVAVINATMAQRYWPGENPTGQTIRIGADGPQLRIVGVARDITYYSLGEQPQSYVYGSTAQFPTDGVTLHILSEGEPLGLVRSVEREVRALDPGAIPRNSTTFDQLRMIPLFPAQAMASVSGVFGLLALIMTAVGIYGVVSYSVNQRLHEIGVRIALGAQRSDIFRLVIGQGLLLVGIGVGVGLALAFGLTRFIGSFLFGLTATDPAVYSGVVFLLAAVALWACTLPARRASNVDPIDTLRDN